MKSLPIILIVLLLVVFFIQKNGGGYKSISQNKAKEMIDNDNVIILDVREKSEYDSGHIKGSVLLPLCTINADTAASVIGDKNSVVLVYCRSGNRSKKASAALAKLGYTNIYEFGGITSWKYGVEY